jgi:hypothetical protein
MSQNPSATSRKPSPLPPYPDIAPSQMMSLNNVTVNAQTRAHTSPHLCLTTSPAEECPLEADSVQHEDISTANLQHLVPAQQQHQLCLHHERSSKEFPLHHSKGSLLMRQQGLSLHTCPEEGLSSSACELRAGCVWLPLEYQVPPVTSSQAGAATEHTGVHFSAYPVFVNHGVVSLFVQCADESECGVQDRVWS